MKLLLMLVIMGLTLVMIFVGANDAAQRKDDHDKFGGDALIKAISEYNEKSNSIHGYIGAVGVTRTPLNNTEGSGTRKSGFSNGLMGNKQGNSLPPYMMNQPSAAQQPMGNGQAKPNADYYPPNPYMPQTHQNNDYPPPPETSSDQDSGQNPAPAQDNGYYPPAPVTAPAPPNQDYSPQSQYKYNPVKEYVVPMTLPVQSLPAEKMRLSSGQQVAFAGVDVYTFDRNGKPVAMPDGIYKMGPLKLHVRDGKNVSE